MDIPGIGLTKRLLLTLAAGAALSGCVAYGPPYASVYDAAPVGSTYYYSPYYAPYYASPYGYGYGYGRSAWAGPPVTLNFGYYEHRYRGGYGGHGGYRGHGGHRGAWAGNGWRGGGHAHGAYRGGHRGGWGGGRGGGGRGHR